VTYEQLKALQAVVQIGTFRGAADKVHKSQPAVSALIRNLEEELGIRLFDRDSYRPKLTPEGEVFYGQAVIALREMGQLKQLAGRMSGGQESEVGIAVNQIYPLRSLLKTLREVDHEYPATRLNVTTESVAGAMDRLIEGNTDIALTTDLGMLADRMEARAFDTVRVIPVSRPDYGPGARAGHHSADDVRGSVQVIVADSSIVGPGQTLDLIPGARHWTVTNLAAKKDIIMAGMGWGGLPEHVVEKELASGKLVRVHVEGFEIRTSQLFLIRRTDRPFGIVAEALWERLSAIVSGS
jgi:DNA-binding transcriptional LysR family regulator